MECGFPYCAPAETAPGKVPHVNFAVADKDDPQDRRKKYLTAKYGPHQMSLIRKRLRVEMWMYEQLQALYDGADDGRDVEIDLDELLDMESDHHRRNFLRAKLVDAKRGGDGVETFIDELMRRAETL